MIQKARQALREIVCFKATRDKFGPSLRPRLAHGEHIGHCTLCWLVFASGHGLEAWVGGATGTVMLVHVIFGLSDSGE